MKKVLVAIAALWVAVLLHGWTTRFMIVPLTGSQYNSAEYAPDREASFMGPPNPQPFGKDRK